MFSAGSCVAKTCSHVAPPFFERQIALLVRSRVERAVAVELDVVDAAGAAVTVPDLGEGLTAVGRLPEPPRCRVRRERHGAAGHRRDAADAAGRADVHRLGVARIDDDRGDRAGVHRSRAAGQERPLVAVVGGCVDPDARLGVTRGVRLAGARVERVRRRVVDQRPDRVRAETVGEERPSRVAGEGVVAPPDAAARCRHPHAARGEPAGRIDGEGGHTPGDAEVGGAVVEDVQHCRHRPGRGADELPAALVVLAAAGDVRLVVGALVVQHGRRQAARRVRERCDLLCFLTRRTAEVVRLPGECARVGIALQVPRPVRQLALVLERSESGEPCRGQHDERQRDERPARRKSLHGVPLLPARGRRLLEALLEPMHDLAIQAPAGALGGGRETVAQFARHPQQKAMRVSPWHEPRTLSG